MKAVLEFDLNDPDDRMEHLRCVKATDMAIVLWEILGLKKATERNFEGRAEIEGDDSAYYEVIDYVFDRIREEMDNKGIIIDDLIS